MQLLKFVGWKFTAINTYIRKEEGSKNNLKKLEKEEQIKLKAG